MPERDLLTRGAQSRRLDAVTADPSRKLRRAHELRTSALLLIALLTTLAGLHIVLAGVNWWFISALLVIVLLTTTTMIRRSFGSERQYLPPLSAALVLVAIVTFFFAPQNALLGLIPTPTTVTDFGVLITEANQSIARQSIPATTVVPLLFLLCLGVGAIVIVADFLANTLRTPALAGIPLLVLLAVPSAVTVDATDPVVFVVAALIYLALLVPAISKPGRYALPLAGLIVIGALVVPLALPAVTPVQGTGSGFSTGINPVITLGQNLRQDVEHTVLTYRTRSGGPEYLKLVNIDNFSGSQWGPSGFTLDRRNTVGKIGPPPGLSPEVKTARETTTVSVEDLTSPWLPLPYPASTVSGLAGDWYWDPNGLVVRSPSRTAQNQQYEATTVTIQPTPAQLEAAGTTIPQNFARYLDLPGSMPAIIGATAQSIAGQAPSNYQKALLLQDYFRNGNFEYSETAPVADGYDGTSTRVIADFLTAKSGYCVHFASAMAVMSRSLGIPARIAVGFLPGTRSTNPSDGTNLYTVTSHNLHAWPELYFEGIGWTRFEPTVSRGSLPGYADVGSADVPTPVNSTAADALPRPAPGLVPPSAAPSQAPIAGPVNSGPTVETDFTALWVTSGFALLLLALLVPAARRAILRRRRLAALRRGAGSAIVAWNEVLETAEDLGIAIPNTATPRGTAQLLAAASSSTADGTKNASSSSALRGAGPREAPVLTFQQQTPSAALDRLRQALERHSYSSQSRASTTAASTTAASTTAASTSAASTTAASTTAASTSAASTTAMVSDVSAMAAVSALAGDVEAVIAELRAAAPPARRWRSILLPRSTWRRSRSARTPD